jgi:hypothetical protein
VTNSIRFCAPNHKQRPVVSGMTVLGGFGSAK